MTNHIPYSISDFYKPVILYNEPFDVDSALNRVYNPVSVKIVKAFDKDIPSLRDLSKESLYSYWLHSLTVLLINALKPEIKNESGLSSIADMLKKNKRLSSLLDIQSLEHPALWISELNNALSERPEDILQDIDCYLDCESKWIVLSYKNIHDKRLAETLLHFWRDETYRLTNIHAKIILEESFYDDLTLNFPGAKEFCDARSIVRLNNHD